MRRPIRWAARSERPVADAHLPRSGRAGRTPAKVQLQGWVNGHVVCRRSRIRRREGSGRAGGAGGGGQGQARCSRSRVHGLRRRQGRHGGRHADPRHHRLPRPFAERRRGQSRRGPGPHDRSPDRGARHGAHAQHAGRRHHGGARLRRQGLHRVRRPRRLQLRPLPWPHHALRRPHDLHDRRSRQPHRPRRRRHRRSGQGGARAGPCRLGPDQDHGDRRRDDPGRQP